MSRFWGAWKRFIEPEPLSPGGFEEKQYEFAANLELAYMGEVFPSGQVLESLLGYDVAASPQKGAPIWRFLEVGAPKGVLLVPSNWSSFSKTPPHDQLPDRKVSLLLQYKRSRKFRTSRAKQWAYWRQPYFRFKVDPEQQFILENLEQSLGRRAVIRYAAPVFAQYKELLAYQREKKVLSKSTYVSPGQLIGHECWTFVEPGKSGYANAEPKEIYAESFDDIIQEASTRAEPGFLAQHLRSLAAALYLPELPREQSPPEWIVKLEEELPRDKPAGFRQAILDFVNISVRLGQSGISWLILMPERRK
jgi:hypothetical protein